MTFRHSALLYDGLDDYLAVAVPFLQQGVDNGEPTLVVVPPMAELALREALTAAEGRVRFLDMTELGRNPGRIISAWSDFADEHAGAPRIRGIGEPVWPGRTTEEVTECHRHEALLNVAISGRQGLDLLCPYDRSGLDETALAAAGSTHPVLVEDGRQVPSPDFVDRVDPFAGDLTAPPPDALSLDLADHALPDVRRTVGDRAHAAGVAPERVSDLVLAVTEAATNSLRHAGGAGTLLTWRDGDAVVCEVRDSGRICDPLAGRRRAPVDRLDGRGLWLVHQLCDLVQVRSGEDGTVVRMRVATGVLPGAPVSLGDG